MPRRDGTGPEGEGPMTGRRMGNCVSKDETMETGRGLGRRYGSQGFRGGQGGRNRRRSMFYATGMTGRQRAAILQADSKGLEQTDEIDMLKQEAAAVADRLERIEKRIEELVTKDQVDEDRDR